MHRRFAKKVDSADAARIHNHYGLRGHRTVLRQPERHQINTGISGEHSDRDSQGGCSIRQSRPIHVHGQAVAVRNLGDRRDLIGRVDSPHLTGLRDAHRARLRSVHKLHVEALALHAVGAEFSLGGWHRPHLDAGHHLRRSAFVGVNMRCCRSDYRLPTVGNRLQGHHIGPGPVEHGVERGLRTEQVLDHVRSAGGHNVVAVCRLVANVHCCQCFQNLWMRAGIVIAGEPSPWLIDHGCFHL